MLGGLNSVHPGLHWVHSGLCWVPTWGLIGVHPGLHGVPVENVNVRFILSTLSLVLSTKQSGPLDFEDPWNQGSWLWGKALALPRSHLGVPSSKLSSPCLALFWEIRFMENVFVIHQNVKYLFDIVLNLISHLSNCLSPQSSTNHIALPQSLHLYSL